jgi:ATP-binding cassette subfamily B protein
MSEMHQFSVMRSFRRDPEVTEKKLAPGTARRIARFASPYRRELTLFLVLIVVAAFLAVLNPLIFKKIIDDGIGTNPPVSGDRGLVVAGPAGRRPRARRRGPAAVVALVLHAHRRGPDLRHALAGLHAHLRACRSPSSPARQTGALISRLNNDVLGRPAGVHRHAVRRRLATSSASC